MVSYSTQKLRRLLNSSGTTDRKFTERGIFISTGWAASAYLLVVASELDSRMKLHILTGDAFKYVSAAFQRGFVLLSISVTED